MIEMFLCSYFAGAATLFEDFAEQNIRAKEVLFIPTAANVEEYRDYVDEAKEAFAKMGFEVQILDVSKASEAEAKAKISAAQVLYVSGGNTFYLLRELKNDGHLIFVSTHDLGSVPEFCDHVVIINKTVLAAGPTETTFTADNLIKAFGGALRTIKLDHTDNPEDSAHEFRVFTDDEGALITKREGKPYRRGVRNIEAVLPK